MGFRAALAWVMLVLGVVACVAVASAAYLLAGYAWNQLVEYQSPYVRRSDVATATSAAVWIPAELRPVYRASSPVMAERVVLVIIDGLREDASRSEMKTLNLLRSYGADVTLTVPQPSLSYPNWTTILTGAPQEISGVTTNWFKGRAPAPTVMDIAEAGGRRVGIVGPEDFATIFGVRRGPMVSLRPWPKGGYLSATLVDDALRIAKASDPHLMVLHLPDLDEAGHEHGGSSDEYTRIARRIDQDLGRLVGGLEDRDTAFVVVADHGHVDAGGHGGWEKEATVVPGVLAGAGIALWTGEGRLEQIAPTISVLSGLPDPPYAVSTALRSAIATTSPQVYRGQTDHRIAFQSHYARVLQGPSGVADSDRLEDGSAAAADALAADAKARRLDAERSARLVAMLAVLLTALAAIAAISVASWRAGVAALVGTAAYYAVYNTLFFVIHGYNWSVSAFNTEGMVKAFMNGRMIEALVSGLVGAGVAGAVYPFLRKEPKSPTSSSFLGGWLALGPATVLVIEATLVIQVALYYWRYGFEISWELPDMMWAFKTDLDMVQVTALGAGAVVAPLVTYLVGRYHPKVARGTMVRGD